MRPVLSWVAVVCLGLLACSGSQAQSYPDPIRVGLLLTPCGGATSQTEDGLADQVSDSIYYNFATVKRIASLSDIDSRQKIQDLDVDVLMYFGSGTYTTPFSSTVNSAIDEWVREGGGGLVTGPGVQNMGTGPSVVPVVLNGNIDVCQDVSTLNNTYRFRSFVDAPSHPAAENLPAQGLYYGAIAWSPQGLTTSGVSDLTTIVRWEIPQISIDEKCQAPPLNNQAFVVGNAGNGRVAYLGQWYCGRNFLYNSNALRSGFPDQLLENALRWASGGTKVETSGASSIGATAATFGVLVLLAAAL